MSYDLSSPTKFKFHENKNLGRFYTVVSISTYKNTYDAAGAQYVHAAIYRDFATYH